MLSNTDYAAVAYTLLENNSQESTGGGLEALQTFRDSTALSRSWTSLDALLSRLQRGKDSDSFSSSISATP